MKRLIGIVLLVLFFVPNAFSAVLSATVPVHQTSTTAANAKINATNGARRQILSKVLSQYSDRNALEDLLQKSSNDDLANLISSTVVSNEQISSTAYSANITMNIDNDAAKRWLTTNNVQNWVPSAESGEKFTAYIVIQNGISDWAELKRIARSEGLEIETQSMSGNQIVAKMPLNYRSRFTAAIRGAGWKSTDNDGVLQIWK